MRSKDLNPLTAEEPTFFAFAEWSRYRFVDSRNVQHVLEPSPPEVEDAAKNQHHTMHIVQYPSVDPIKKPH